MKKYIGNMDIQEVIKRLLDGEVLLSEEYPENKIYMLNGVIIKETEHHFIINDSIVKRGGLYFEVEEPEDEITEPGLYKTRDGRRAFVAYIEDFGLYPAKGKIEGTSEEFSWTRKGYDIDNENYNTDIVSKLEE